MSAAKGIVADPGVLAAAAGRIRAAVAVAEVAVGALSGPGPPSGADPRLGAAVEGFLRAWRGELGDVLAGARRLADALELAAAAYQDVELAASASFPGAVRRALG